MPIRWVFILLMCLVLPAAASAAVPIQVSLDRILPQVRDHMPGTLYDVQGPYRDRNGELRYRLKWMTPDGEILWIVVDGRNGDILRILSNVKPHPDYDDRGAPNGRRRPPQDSGYGNDNYGPPRGGPGPRG